MEASPRGAADLRHIYQAATAEEAELRLGEFEAKWDADYLPIGQSWRRNWSRLMLARVQYSSGVRAERILRECSQS